MARENKNNMTKDRILNQAENLFARQGYHGVTVREITEAANCNLAAINYHFGSKRNLYLDVFRFRWLPRAKRMIERVIMNFEKHETRTRTDIVRALSHAYLKGPLTDEERIRHTLLIFRELAEPTEAFDLATEGALKPLFKAIGDRLQPLLTAKLEEKQLILNIFSMFAMATFFSFARAAVTSITGQKYDQEFKTMLVDHITNFSLNGLAAYDEG